LIENNRNLIFFLRLMDLRENCGICMNGDRGRIIPKRGMKTGMENISYGKKRNGKGAQSLPC
jgi:hypothetical protein